MNVPVRPRQSAAPVNPARAPGLRDKFRDFFAYEIEFNGVAPGATANGQIQIQADADFELQKLSQFANSAFASQTEATRLLPLMSVQITDTGTGRQMFNSPVAIPALFGDGRIPFILPTTKIFSKNASVAFVVTNFDAAVTYNLTLVLIGAKIFTYS